MIILAYIANIGESMRTLFIALFLSSSLFAIGEEAVIILAFPYGAEVNGLGESGVAFSNDLGTTYLNPANASFYGSRNNVNFDFSGGFQKLLPSLHIDGMTASHGAVGVFLPKLFGDFGLSFSNNSHWVYFGEIWDYDAMGVTTDVSTAYEFVNSSTVSGNWKDYIALGFTIKPFYSQLGDTITTSGLVFDLGVRGQYELTMQDEFFLTPGIGFSISNLGQDSITYQQDTDNINPDSIDYSPLAKNMRLGFSVEGGRKDVISGACIYDLLCDLVPDNNGVRDKGIHQIGLQLRATPIVDINQGFLLDKTGQRYEYHMGATIGLRRDAMRRYLLYKNPNRTFEEAKNIQALYSFSIIMAMGDNDVRQNQMSHQLSYSISFGKSSPHRGSTELELQE